MLHLGTTRGKTGGNRPTLQNKFGNSALRALTYGVDFVSELQDI